MARRRRDTARTANPPPGDQSAPTAAIADGSETGPNRTPLGTMPIGKEPSVSHVSPSSEGPVPSLVGSLSVFDLSRVLTWLAAGSQTGELRVEGTGIDGRIWLLHGELSNAQVGTADTIGQAIFELARLEDGSFQYTDGPVSSSGEAPVPVAGVLSEVSANVDEWRAIRRIIPAGSAVALCPEPPDHDVKIRSDQWRLLTCVGAGDRTVEEVIDLSGSGSQIAAMRALRDLHVAGLITVTSPSDAALAQAHGTVPAPEGMADITPLTAPIHGHAALSEEAPFEHVAVRSPENDEGQPIATGTGSSSNPWASLAEATPSSDNGVA
jgi:hypothetical protein